LFASVLGFIAARSPHRARHRDGSAASSGPSQRENNTMVSITSRFDPCGSAFLCVLESKNKNPEQSEK
jgi:hypothetical protein